MINVLGDLSSTTSDHQAGDVGVTSHIDGVVDRRPGAGDGGCHHWYTKGMGKA
jgi:hypothetical protein